MIGEIIPQILGIDLASFLDKTSNVNNCIQFGGFLKKKIILDFLSRNDASSNPVIRILKFLGDSDVGDIVMLMTL